ncbi:MAG: cytochrome c3 family protein [Coriobacteriia bacterium]|nr:cytochrome c3 family protein [Coriobacteriia bacterium]
MKKTYILALTVLVALVVVAVPTLAFANAGPHGGYIANTEACAGCHRAHTAPSSITWTDSSNVQHSALLLSTATRLDQFCLVCHDAGAQGGDTNVVDGIFEGSTIVNGSTGGGKLLGGAFGRFDPAGAQGPGQYDGDGNLVSSTHTYWYDGTDGKWQAWGGGAFGSASVLEASGNVNAVSFLGGGAKIAMDCGSCHDPHGSTNYRILKDKVYGVPVGGYSGGTELDPDPFPYVISAEVGYPTAGFRLHTQYGAYIPNYTSAQYAKAPGGDASKGMVGWCVGCHTVYASKTSSYNAGDGYGYGTRHRHPVNVPLTNYQGARSLVITTSPLPLAHDVAEAGTVANSQSDWIDCLTCHNAHGASTVMTGYANVASSLDPAPNSGSGGVDPTNDSALLKMNNRGVCEACHNK